MRRGFVLSSKPVTFAMCFEEGTLRGRLFLTDVAACKRGGSSIGQSIGLQNRGFRVRVLAISQIILTFGFLGILGGRSLHK